MISYQSAGTYCYEDIAKIENYALAMSDESQVWHCHHRLEIIMNCGKRELIAKGAYFDRPAHELIFLTKAEHMRLHKIGNKNFLGKSHSDETRRKMSETTLTKKPVEMKRMSDGFNKVFPSYSEAARWLRENGYPKATIIRVSDCANGHRASAYNAIWRNL